MTDTEIQATRADFMAELEGLDLENCVEAARALLYAAEAVQQQCKPQLKPAVKFLATLSAAMNGKALQRAESEGLAPERTQEELETALARQERQRLN